jgi:hypothetical protein
MTDATSAWDPRYVVARAVLLDALDALSVHRDAVIVVGAQAIYLQIGAGDIAIAPFTTDGDLALDPSRLPDDPVLEDTMREAGFTLLEPASGGTEPGIWVASRKVHNTSMTIPVDLIVPEAVSSGQGRRGARLGAHGKKAARRAEGLEAALVDNSLTDVVALDPSDARKVKVRVAGLPALLVAKTHKIGDRVQDGRENRLIDKDAADVFRIMQSADRVAFAGMVQALLVDPIAADATARGLEYLSAQFGTRRAPGILMASRALRTAIPGERVAAIAMDFTNFVRESVA